MIEWQESKAPDGARTREFRITVDNRRDITGAVWLPDEAATAKTLMCFGHGASGDRYQPPITDFAHRMSRDHGLPVLSIDGPVHGLREVAPGGRQAFFPEFRRDAALVDMTSDWALAIDAARALPMIDADGIAYFGLSMGSIFGIPMIASRKDVKVAVLGLFGIQDSFPHEAAFVDAARKITCPVFYLMQLEDELFGREGYLRAFDELAATDKQLHANPGLHPAVPAETLERAFDFLVDSVEGRRQPHAESESIAT